MRVHVALVGDSDIHQWPPLLLPSVDGAAVTHSVSGHNGATLEQVIPHVQAILREIVGSKDSPDRVILVVCAGENDIGSIALEKSEVDFKRLLSIIFPNDKAHPEQSPGRSLIFLGPKFEPWLTDDRDSRKAYIRMSKSFDSICSTFVGGFPASDAQSKQRHSPFSRPQVMYFNCLLMFCGESGKQPGAVLGGKAKPEEALFDRDGLHLSAKGYEIWKSVVEECVGRILHDT